MSINRTIIDSELGTVDIISKNRVEIDEVSYDKYTVGFLSSSRRAAKMKARSIGRMLSDKRLIEGDMVILSIDDKGVPEPRFIFDRILPDKLRRKKWVAEIAIVDRDES